MSRATIDRCPKRVRYTNPRGGLSTTKPGSLLKQAIPIRTFTPWEDERAGFLEIDLIAHYGSPNETLLRSCQTEHITFMTLSKE